MLERFTQRCFLTRLVGIAVAVVIASLPVVVVSILREGTYSPSWADIKGEALVAAGTVAFVGAADLIANSGVSNARTLFGFVAMAIGMTALVGGSHHIVTRSLIADGRALAAFCVVALAVCFIVAPDYKSMIELQRAEAEAVDHV